MGNSKPKALAGCSEEEGKTQRVGSWLVVRQETVSLKEERETHTEDKGRDGETGKEKDSQTEKQTQAEIAELLTSRLLESASTPHVPTGNLLVS